MTERRRVDRRQAEKVDAVARQRELVVARLKSAVHDGRDTQLAKPRNVASVDCAADRHVGRDPGQVHARWCELGDAGETLSSKPEDVLDQTR